jgi:hypothetical protein
MKDTASEMPADQFKPEELIQILKDAIEADEVEFVRSQFVKVEISMGRLHDFVCAAAKTASPTMVDFLLEKYALAWPDHRDIKQKALRASIWAGNMVVIKHLIARGAKVNPNDISFIKAALDTYNPEIVEILLGHGAHLVEHPSLFYKILWADQKREEDEVFKIVHRMHKYVVGKKPFSNGFGPAIDRGLIPLAKYFIDNGADVNVWWNGGPILYSLVRDGKRRHAEAIKFLLQQGANPYPFGRGGHSIKSLAGMQKVEQYFDKSWDDLVREARAERASTTNEG